LRIHHGSIICFTNLLWINFLFREFIMDSLSFSRIHYQFTIYLANSLLINYFFRELTLNSLSPEFTMDPFSFERIHYRFTIYLANLLWIHYLLREFTRDSLFFRAFTLNPSSSLRIHYKITISFANSLGIHYLIRQSAILSVSRSIHYFVSQIHSLFTFFSRDHYGSFICFVNSLFISVRSMTKLLLDSWTITKTITI